MGLEAEKVQNISVVVFALSGRLSHCIRPNQRPGREMQLLHNRIEHTKQIQKLCSFTSYFTSGNQRNGQAK